MRAVLLPFASLTLLAAACASRQPAGARVRFDGYRTVRIGMTTAEAMRAWDDAPLVAANPPIPDDLDCTHLYPGGRPGSFAFMAVDGVIVRVEVREAGILTERGVGVGSSEAEVRAAYPDVAVSPHAYVDGHYLTVAGPGDLRLVFETDGRQVTELRAGRRPEVEWIEGCS